MKNAINTEIRELHGEINYINYIGSTRKRQNIGKTFCSHVQALNVIKLIMIIQNPLLPPHNIRYNDMLHNK